MSNTEVRSLEGLHPTGNLAVLESVRPYFESQGSSCSFSSSSSQCNPGMYNFGDTGANVYYGSSIGCNIMHMTGESHCAV